MTRSPYAAYVLGVVHCFAIICLLFGTNAFTRLFGAALIGVTVIGMTVLLARREIRR